MLLADMYGAGYGDREKEEDELLRRARGARNDLPSVLGCGAAGYEAL